MGELISVNFFKPHPEVDRLRKELIELYITYDSYLAFESELLAITHLQLYGDLLLRREDIEYRYRRLQRKLWMIDEKIFLKESFSKDEIDKKLDIFYREQRRHLASLEKEIRQAQATWGHIDQQDKKIDWNSVNRYREILLKLDPRLLIIWYHPQNMAFILIRDAFFEQNDEQLNFWLEIMNDEQSQINLQEGLLDESMIAPLSVEIKNLKIQIALIEKEYPLSMKETMFDSIQSGDYQMKIEKEINLFQEGLDALREKWEYQAEQIVELDLLKPSQQETGKEYPPLMILEGADQGIRMQRTHIAGTSYIEDIDEIIEEMTVGEQLRLVREPENIYDEKAIRIENLAGEKIGYIPKDENNLYARLMDDGFYLFARFVSCEERGTWLYIVMDIYIKKD